MNASGDSESIPLDWQLNRSLSECTTQLYMNEHMSDVTIVLTSVQPPRRVPAHRFLLAIRSPVFEAMFYGLLETVAKEVTLNDVPVDGFLALLRFMYTDVAEIHADNVVEYLQVGHMYRVPGFVQKCESMLMKSIDVANVLCILQTSLIFCLQTLKEHCLAYIAINASSTLKHESFLSINNEMLAMIIRKSDLQTPELEVFQAVNRWAERKCELEDVLSSHENKRKYLGDTFSFLRLGHIPMSDFARVVVKENLLSKDEIVMVFCLHHDDNVSALDFVENAKRVGSEVCTVPLKLVELPRVAQPLFFKLCFEFNQAVNLVGLTVDGNLNQFRNTAINHYISVFMTWYTDKLGKQHYFRENGTVYHLENSSLVKYCDGNDITDFDILFDSSYSLQPNVCHKISIVIMSLLGKITRPNASLASWKLIPKDNWKLKDDLKYVRHELDNEEVGSITALLTT